MNLKLIVTTLAVLALLGGCSWFGRDDESEEAKPSPLSQINEEVSLSVVWSKKIGKGAGDRAIRLKPVVWGTRVIAASADGSIKALETSNGNVIWERQVKDFYTKEEIAHAFPKDLDVITGGVGASGELVVVGTSAGDVVTLRLADGSLVWKTAVSSEILAPPAVDNDVVVVQTIDGKIAAYNVADGRRLWIYTMTIPSLTLRGTATPLLTSELVIAGFGNGRIAFLSKESGLAGFDQKIAVSQGSSDLERLVDIDGEMALDGGKLFVVSFQGRLVAADMAGGRLLWSEEASSVAGVGTGFGNVYLSRADGQISAFNQDTGRKVWNVDALLHRSLSAPVSISSYIAVTDFDGYVHVLAQSDGRFVGRRKVASGGLKAGLVSNAGRIYAMSDDGALSVLEVR